MPLLCIVPNLGRQEFPATFNACIHESMFFGEAVMIRFLTTIRSLFQVPGSITGQQTVRKAIRQTASWPSNRWLFSGAEYSSAEKCRGATRMRPHPCSEISLQWSPTVRSLLRVPQNTANLKWFLTEVLVGVGISPAPLWSRVLHYRFGKLLVVCVFSTLSQAYIKGDKTQAHSDKCAQ